MAIKTLESEITNGVWMDQQKTTELRNLNSNINEYVFDVVCFKNIFLAQNVQA